MPSDPWDVKQIEAKAPDAKSVSEARKVLAKGGFGKVEPRADGQGWYVVCQGMTGTYEVSVKRGPRGGLESRCTCPSSKRPCKHALALLLYLAEHPEARPEAEAPAAKPALDFEPLLRNAFANPDDDTARLVLADFLEENDQPDRAALIRVQCERPRLKKTEPGYADLIEREETLLLAVWKQLGKLPSGFGGSFHRGFLSLTMTGYTKIRKMDDFPARFAKLFRDGWVEEFRPRLFQPLMLPAYKLVGTLDLTDRYASVTDADVRQLAKEVGPHVADARTRFVKLNEPHRTQYEMLAGGAIS